jgi:hypothetical protein
LAQVEAGELPAGYRLPPHCGGWRIDGFRPISENTIAFAAVARCRVLYQP